MSLYNNTYKPNTVILNVFSITPYLNFKNCLGLNSSLAHCDFDRVATEAANLRIMTHSLSPPASNRANGLFITLLTPTFPIGEDIVLL